MKVAKPLGEDARLNLDADNFDLRRGECCEQLFDGGALRRDEDELLLRARVPSDVAGADVADQQLGRVCVKRARGAFHDLRGQVAFVPSFDPNVFHLDGRLGQGDRDATTLKAAGAERFADRFDGECAIRLGRGVRRCGNLDRVGVNHLELGVARLDLRESERTAAEIDADWVATLRDKVSNESEHRTSGGARAERHL